jgi:hypothetical protein
MAGLWVFVILAWAICGAISGAVWTSKGGDYAAGFWIGAILGVFGLLYVAFADPGGAYRYPSNWSPPVAQLEPNTKSCPRCAEEVKAAALVCRYCSHEFKQTVSLPVGMTDSTPSPEGTIFAGGEISHVVVHAFGVQWGKAPDGRTVFRRKDSDDWVLYEKESSPLVPPRARLAEDEDARTVFASSGTEPTWRRRDEPE